MVGRAVDSLVPSPERLHPWFTVQPDDKNPITPAAIRITLIGMMYVLRAVRRKMASSSTDSPSGIAPLPGELSLGEFVAAHDPQTVYMKTTAQGSSRNHYGNSYNIHNGPVYHQPGTDVSSEVTAEQDQDVLDIADLRKALAFDTMDDRYATIRAAHGQTCQWLFKSSEYRSWRDPAYRPQHHGILWVKGKPGAGKSTLMKCAYTHGSTTLRDEVVIAFFFNARGDDLQRSTMGLYRSLLGQLLDQLLSRIPNLPATLLAQPSRRRCIKRRDLPIELLKDLFREIIFSLGSIKLTCYIDALDECPENSIRDLLDFLEDLGTSTLRAGIAFSIMLSSRYYPNITVRHATELNLESTKGHHQDLSAYIHDKLRIDDPTLARGLASGIESRSSGVFLWVVLVVAMLNEEHDRGNRHLLSDRLRELPDELHSLFQQMVQKDSHDRASIVEIFLWILYAKRPLQLKEYYNAVVISQQGYSLDGWDPSEASEQDMTRFITDKSRGLIEMTRGSFPKVQFIHESVRDFLFADGFGLLEPGLASGDKNIASVIHERLYQCCHRHMLLYASLELRLPTDGVRAYMQTRFTDARSIRERMHKKYPFITYVLESMLWHAESMLKLGHEDSQCAHTFPYEIWIRLYNLTVFSPFRRNGEDVSREYLFAIEGCYYLLKEATRDESQVSRWDRRVYGERFTCLLAVALHYCDQEMVDMLRKHGATED
jgi:hypothetical protein